MSVEYRTNELDLAEDGATEAEQEPESREYFGVPQYTCVLVGCIIAVTVVQLFAGLERSVDAAGFDKPLFARGEYWRLFTGAALHGGLLHIFFNSYAFYSFGRLFEFLSDRAHLAIVFLLAVIGGGFMSLLFMPDGRSVGASGGILGLVSYLAVYAFKRRRFVSAEFRKSLLLNIGFILVFGLLLYDIIDNFGHIGGLLTGAIYGLVQIPSDEYVDPRETGPVTRVIGLAALLFFVAVSVFSIYLIADPQRTAGPSGPFAALNEGAVSGQFRPASR